ncbi:MAG: BamA/TamA family outer membrane protein, partial [Gemmatimonadales bacterium]
MSNSLNRAILLSTLPPLLGAGMIGAQSPPPPPSGPDSVASVAGSRYDAGGFHRFLFGDNHREAWITPIQVPVLNLEKFEGGLTPTETGGGMQTRSLHLETDDGREFVFRSVDKDMTPIVPPDLEGSLVHKLFQDQASAMHPFGALVVAALLEAAGIPHAEPTLMVMPEDPRLDEFREEFAGMLGLLEERPNEGPDDTRGFAGSRKITGTDELFEALNADPDNRPDALAYLEARLFDMWVNDWDRHTDQWRWAYRPRGGDSVWTPIPRDRDQAFVHFDGFLTGIGRLIHPKLIPFDSTYPSLKGLTANSVELDSRLLAGVERAAYDSLAKALQSRFTDQVIGRAMTRLPPAIRALDSAAIAADLQSRLRDLDDLAGRFYRRQADIVDVHATDVAEIAILERHTDGGVTLSIAALAGDGNTPWYHRRFHPG